MTRLYDRLHLARKLGRIVVEPSYRRGLMQGVAAAVEHEQVVFPRDYKSVIDVGANRGQFILFARRRFPGASVICFEPLPTAHRKLEKIIGVSSTQQIYQCAIGATAGRVNINVTRKDDSSSLLSPTVLQTQTFRNTEAVASIEVEVKRLDDAIDRTQLVLPFLLKIDVQGFELEVIKGSELLLQEDGDVLVEASFAELYKGQALIDEIVVTMWRLGYRLHGIFSITKDSRGMPLQGDLLFSRTPASW